MSLADLLNEPEGVLGDHRVLLAFEVYSLRPLAHLGAQALSASFAKRRTASKVWKRFRYFKTVEPSCTSISCHHVPLIQLPV